MVGLCSLALVLVGLAESSSDSSADQAPSNNGPSDAALASQIAELRNKKNLVGLGAMIMVDGKVVASAVQGERKKSSGVLLELGDRWHLGSITKSVTATMIARLVESGEMQWSCTISEIFPDAAIHEDWKPVTLKQLLTHTAGAPANFPREVRRQRPALGPECTKARQEAVLNVIANRPTYPPGTKREYSNVGYTIAGAMAEKKTGAAWEDLVKREVFEPLELSDAGFGPPKSADKTLEQPRGHQSKWFGWTKVAVDEKADNTPIMGPAGTVHMALRDLCTYGMEHLRGELGQGKLLSTETYKVLHTPELDDYACGWVTIGSRTKGQPTVCWHNGSNTLWYALVVFIPENAIVVAVAANDGDVDSAEAAAWEIVRASITDDHTLQDIVAGMGYDPTLQEILQEIGYPKKSPFAAVRWKDSQPEVKLGEEWFKLVSLNELPVSDILAFSRQTYGNKWRKRFEEDLVELLSRMGHPPQDEVTLVVKSLTSSETRPLGDVAMTEANRRANYKAARAREADN